MVASTFGVAAWVVMVTQGSWAWGWVPALVFGARISATDPVAVVALLRELGAPKRLAAGVWMSGLGRVHISPEVEHFLHRFWQVLASIANTLTFFLVGLVVAASVGEAGLEELWVVVAAFVGILVLRGGILAVSRPVLSWLSGPVSGGEATVMAWGGLRGAVSPALALMVSQEHALLHALRGQILLVTAGVVLGTLSVNGTTIGWLLGRLGVADAPAADRLAQAATRATILDAVAEELDAAKGSDDLRTVNGSRVDAELGTRRAEVEEARRHAESELGATSEGRRAGPWRQALRMERVAVWDAYAKGTLSATAVQILDADVDARTQVIEKGNLEAATPDRDGRLPGWRGSVEQWLNTPGRTLSPLRFWLLELRDELARGRRLAASRVLEALERGEIDAEELREAYKVYRQAATRLLEEMRANLPEVTEALETRVAQRISLNLERDAVARLEGRGPWTPTRPVAHGPRSRSG